MLNDQVTYTIFNEFWSGFPGFSSDFKLGLINLFFFPKFSIAHPDACVFFA